MVNEGCHALWACAPLEHRLLPPQAMLNRTYTCCYAEYAMVMSTREEREPYHHMAWSTHAILLCCAAVYASNMLKKYIPEEPQSLPERHQHKKLLMLPLVFSFQAGSSFQHIHTWITLLFQVPELLHTYYCWLLLHKEGDIWEFELFSSYEQPHRHAKIEI